MKIPDSSAADPPPQLRRRDFLALGSAGLLMPLFENLAWAEPLATRAATAAAVVTLPMSVGYVDGSEELRDLKHLPRALRRPTPTGEAQETTIPVIVPAISLFQADTSMPGHPLRIRVHGLYPPVALDRKRRREVPTAVDLEAIFPSSDPAFPNPLTFYAWSLRQKPGWSPSPPISYRFPLEWQVLPELVLRVRGTDGISRVLRTKFTVDNEPGRPKLRRGVYVLGFDPRAWQAQVPVSDLARSAPAEMFSIMISMESEPAPAT